MLSLSSLLLVKLLDSDGDIPDDERGELLKEEGDNDDDARRLPLVDGLGLVLVVLGALGVALGFATDLAGIWESKPENELGLLGVSAASGLIPIAVGFKPGVTLT